MGKPSRRRRTRTVRAELKARCGQVEPCTACGGLVPWGEGTYVASGPAIAVYCLDCARANDPEGYVALLWGGAIPERGREVVSPSSLPCE
jgi:hypothetical protein